jgi:predicted Zn-ribbon and HTH transcriptional regulator
MGNIVMAVCSNCSLESDTIYQGIGFRYYEKGIRTEPAYCDACGVVVGRDISKSYSKCPKCRRKVKFYKEDVEESETEEQLGLPGDYLQEKKFWHCPRCKEEALQFQSMGMWD